MVAPINFFPIKTGLIISVLFATSYAQAVWTWRNPLPTNSDLVSIAYGNGTYVAVGRQGSIISSTNGIDWSLRSSGRMRMLRSVAWGNNQFVTVGDSGGIFTSPDGATWTNQTSGTQQIIYSVIWTDTQFVAVYSDQMINGALIASSNGITWKTLYSGALLRYADNVSYANHTYFASGYYGGTVSSPNGVNWSLISNTKYLKVLWDGNQYVCISEIRGSGISTSPDGATWTQQWTDTSNILHTLFLSNNQFIGFGYNSYNRTIGMVTSPDAKSWTKQTFFVGAQINAVMKSANQYVAVGNVGKVITSSDGITWTPRSSGPTINFFGISWNGSKYVAIGTCSYSDTSKIITIATSNNGIDWAAQSAGSVCLLNDIAWGNGQFISVGEYGRIITSPDGLNWADHKTDSLITISAITYGNNQFFAVGYELDSSHAHMNRYIITSSNGINWTKQAIDTGYLTLNDVCWSNNMFVSVGDNNIVSSPDGVTWTNRLFDSKKSFFSIAWGNNTFVASGSWGWYSTSPDGITWTNHKIKDTTYTLKKVMYGNHEFVMIANKYLGTFESICRILTSADGITWTEKASLSQNFYDIVWNGLQYTLVGGNGAILTSPSATGLQPKQTIINKMENITIANNKIRYSLVSAADVSIRLFTIQGRLAKTLCTSPQRPGSFEVTIPKDLAEGRYVVDYQAGKIQIEKGIAFMK